MVLLNIVYRFQALQFISLSMNLLGHARLSFGKPDILVGNMISDYVKGKKQYDYPPGIFAGIRLHREIDLFTDTHEAIKAIAAYFKPDYRLYAYAITDVVLDYFLANDTNEFQNEKMLFDFSQKVYSDLESKSNYFPIIFQQMFPYMQQQNWLYNYRTMEGIERSMQGLKRRAAHIHEMETAYSVFKNNTEKIRELYQQFFPEVKKFAADNLQALLNR
ncbi:MAG: ACP phosphodiesterase [Ferruginibacter sp.]